MVLHTLSCSETIPTAVDETATGRIYTSLLVWMHVQWFRATYSKQCIYTYLARKGLKRKNLVLTNFLSYYNIILSRYIYIYIYIYTYITILQSRQIMLQLLRLLVKHNSLESTVFFLLSKFSGISRDSKNILQTIEQLIKENFSGLFVFWTSRSKREIPQGLFDGYVYLTYRPVYLHINKIVALFDEMVSTNNV